MFYNYIMKIALFKIIYQKKQAIKISKLKIIIFSKNANQMVFGGRAVHVP